MTAAVHPNWNAPQGAERSLTDRRKRDEPSWLAEAIARYRAGEGLKTLNACYHADMRGFLLAAGIPIRTKSEAWALRRQRARALRPVVPEFGTTAWERLPKHAAALARLEKIANDRIAADREEVARWTMGEAPVT